MKPLIILVALACGSMAAVAQSTPVLFPRLSKTLDSLAFVDQRPMQAMMQGRLPDSTFKRLEAEQHANFARHQPILEMILRQYGFPGFRQVGEQSSSNFWLLVQHADAYPAFQRRVLELMKAQVLAKNANPSNYAYLTDRVAENAGQPQEYGTQVKFTGPNGSKAEPRSLRDPQNVNKRRAAMGMQTLEEYLLMNEKIHQQMNRPSAAPR